MVLTEQKRARNLRGRHGKTRIVSANVGDTGNMCCGKAGALRPRANQAGPNPAGCGHCPVAPMFVSLRALGTGCGSTRSGARRKPTWGSTTSRSLERGPFFLFAPKSLAKLGRNVVPHAPSDFAKKTTLRVRCRCVAQPVSRPCLPEDAVSQFHLGGSKCRNVCVCVCSNAPGVDQWPQNRRVSEGPRGAGRAAKHAGIKDDTWCLARGSAATRARAHGGARQPPSMPRPFSTSCRLGSRQLVLKPCNSQSVSGPFSAGPVPILQPSTLR